MDIYSILQSAGAYIYLGLSLLAALVKMGCEKLYAAIMSIPFPTVMKLFGNPTTNKIVFGAVAAYILAINTAAFAMFRSDKKKAEKKKYRTPEKKLLRICILGGAAGGMLGMSAAHHKTNVSKFKYSVPILFIIQLVIYSMLLGFLGFWAFF